MAFTNCYDDAIRVESYARLEFANTYHLAFRDLPQIVLEHVSGKHAIDFGCGTGRSSRFLRQLGFNVTGIDISPEMIAKARQLDPGGDYRLVEDDDFRQLEADTYDLALSAFTFDNIPGLDTKLRLFRDLRALLQTSGKLISIVSAPEIYLHEWASFSTKGYPENRLARSGDIVRIITTDFSDRRPAEDILCTDECYRQIYTQACLEVVAMYKPLAKGDEPYQWVNEIKIAPWVIYVLTQSGDGS